MTELSDEATDKLQAALNYVAASERLGADYQTACRAWFARLTEGERWRVAVVLMAHENGEAERAESIASRLPPAPRCPL